MSTCLHQQLYEVVFYNDLSNILYVPVVPLQLLHVGAVFWKDPNPPSVRRPPVQMKSQVINLTWLAAGEARYLTGPWKRMEVVDPQKVSGLMGQNIKLETQNKSTKKVKKLKVNQIDSSGFALKNIIFVPKRSS